MSARAGAAVRLRRSLALARRTAAARRLPPRAAAFQLAATVAAAARGDRWAIDSATRPDDLRRLVELAAGAASVADVGTGPGWSALTLALADPRRRVLSCDPVDRPQPRRYARLAGRQAAARVEFRIATGEQAAAGADPVDFVFLDSGHERDETIATFRAWAARLRPSGTIVFHDYGNPAYPGVAEAVAELGLEGDVQGELFVWRRPPPVR